MKVAKLVLGIISIILFVLIEFQSCTAGLYNTIGETGSISGTIGFITGFIVLVAGIVGISTRNSKGGTLTAAGFYFLAALLGIFLHGTYSDLIIWGVVSLIFGVVFAISGYKMSRVQIEDKNNSDSE